MVIHYMVVDITTPKGAPSIKYPESWDAYKIDVRAYDDINHTCLAITEDEELFDKLISSGKVTEMGDTEFESELVRLRPPAPEVRVTLTGKGKGYATDIETMLKARGVSYLIEEA